jgi:hypothetical protein
MKEIKASIPEQPFLQFIFSNWNATDIYSRIAYQGINLLNRHKTIFIAKRASYKIRNTNVEPRLITDIFY